MFTTALASDKEARGRRLSPSTFAEACALLCFELHYSVADLEQVGRGGLYSRAPLVAVTNSCVG